MREIERLKKQEGEDSESHKAAETLSASDASMKIKLHNYIVTMYTQQVESNEHVQQQQVKY